MVNFRKKSRNIKSKKTNSQKTNSQKTKSQKTNSQKTIKHGGATTKGERGMNPGLRGTGHREEGGKIRPTSTPPAPDKDEEIKLKQELILQMTNDIEKVCKAKVDRKQELEAELAELEKKAKAAAAAAASATAEVAKGAEKPEFSVEDKIEGNYAGVGKYYPGTITQVNTNGTYNIKYDDGDTEDSVPAENIRKIAQEAQAPPTVSEPSSEKIEDKFLAKILPKLKEITTEIEETKIGKGKDGAVASIPIEKNLYKGLFNVEGISVYLKSEYTEIVEKINEELKLETKKIVKIMADIDILKEGDGEVNVTFFAVNKDDIAKVPTAIEQQQQQQQQQQAAEEAKKPVKFTININIETPGEYRDLTKKKPMTRAPINILMENPNEKFPLSTYGKDILPVGKGRWDALEQREIQMSANDWLNKKTERFIDKDGYIWTYTVDKDSIERRNKDGAWSKSSAASAAPATAAAQAPVAAPAPAAQEPTNTDDEKLTTLLTGKTCQQIIYIFDYIFTTYKTDLNQTEIKNFPRTLFVKILNNKRDNTLVTQEQIKQILDLINSSINIKSKLLEEINKQDYNEETFMREAAEAAAAPATSAAQAAPAPATSAAAADNKRKPLSKLKTVAKTVVVAKNLETLLEDTNIEELLTKVKKIRDKALETNNNALEDQADRFISELEKQPNKEDMVNNNEIVEYIPDDYPLVNDELKNSFQGGKRRRTRWRPRKKKSNKTYRKKPKKIRQKKNKTQRKRKR